VHGMFFQHDVAATVLIFPLALSVKKSVKIMDNFHQFFTEKLEMFNQCLFFVALWKNHLDLV
jgi:hypothetical protein